MVASMTNLPAYLALLRAMTLVAAALVTLAACGGVAYTYDPQTRQVTNMKRFSSMEAGTYDAIDAPLRNEIGGRRPPGGHKTWAGFWRTRIGWWREYKDAHYEEYFFRKRRELGLSGFERP